MTDRTDETPSPQQPAETTQPTTANSTYGDERWQGPAFAASWISPPARQRYADDPTAPSRGDDHA